MYTILVSHPRATAIAGSNIAFVKYWGNLDDAQNIPMNGSISMTLDAAHTITTVEFHPDLPSDQLTINSQLADRVAVERASAHLDHIRNLARKFWPARIISTNSFPTGAGTASSASGFAAFTVAASKALGLKLSSAAALQKEILNVEGFQNTLLCGIGAGAKIIDSDLHPYGYGASCKEHSLHL
jgi:diphosphomevalonate decarboxylase